MSTPMYSIGCFLVASLVGAVGQLFYKAGAAQMNGSAESILLNVRLWAGVGCYALVMVLFLAAFKRGGSLSVLYPIYASTFIWAALLSHLIYATPIKPPHVVGMLALMTGMWLMGR